MIFKFSNIETFSKAPVQPGSLDSEAGIFALTFDKSESRLISCEGDKTIKIYKVSFSPLVSTLKPKNDSDSKNKFPGR